MTVGAITARPVGRLVRPRSVAIVGASADPTTIGGAVVTNFERFGFAGDLHLVSRRATEIRGRSCVPSIADLPLGVDVVALVLPEAAVLDAVAACAERKAGAAVIFAAGFAEAGSAGVAKQQALVAVARRGGVALIGPNCIGIINYADRMPLTFEPIEPQPVGDGYGVGVIAQSGGMSGAVRSAVMAKGVPVTCCISSGNEADLGAEDFLAHLIEDDRTRVISLFIEQARRPQLFLALAARARARGKPIVLMHPGRSQRARESAQSHTGALAGDYAVMHTLLSREAVVIVDTLDELIDVSVLLARNATPPSGGVGILTNSGAFRGISLDFCDDLGLDLPPLAPATVAAMREVLPLFAAFDNPVDVTTAGMTNPGIFGDSARLMLDDPSTGSLLVSIMGGAPRQQVAKAQALLPVISAAKKPVALAVMGDEAPLNPEFLAMVANAQVPFFRSPERAMRALARITAYGRALALATTRAAGASFAAPDLPGSGVLPEYLSKRYLAAAGVPVPPGALAQSPDEAITAAARIGYPVVLKAQSAALSHKSDAGGVAVGIADAAALRQAWSTMQAHLSKARPDVALDGILVEAMAAPGLEMIVGARRDPDWGPVLMVGLGGVWAEAFKDVGLLPADSGEDEICRKIDELKAAVLLRGFRGAPALDVNAVARTLVRLGGLMRVTPALSEIDINPLVVYPAGKGVMALDALVIAEKLRPTCTGA